MQYLVNVLSALSIVLNALTGGSYRNTFSARVGYASSKGAKWASLMEKVINALPLLAATHCKNEAKNELLL